MRRGYLNPLGTGMRFDFSSPLGMGMVTNKYMRVGYGDREGKIRPHPAPFPCLGSSNPLFSTTFIMSCLCLFVIFWH